MCVCVCVCVCVYVCVRVCPIFNVCVSIMIVVSFFKISPLKLAPQSHFSSGFTSWYVCCSEPRLIRFASKIASKLKVNSRKPFDKVPYLSQDLRQRARRSANDSETSRAAHLRRRTINRHGGGVQRPSSDFIARLEERKYECEEKSEPIELKR